MEDEKKKKRNKKKKNKANKTTGDVTHGTGESVNADQNHVIEGNLDNQVLQTADVQNDVLKTTVDLERCCANGTEGSVEAEEEKRYWSDIEASSDETIKKLQPEHNALIEKEVSLDETIKKLHENDTLIQKEASLDETIKKLQQEIDTLIQKEVSLDETIKELQQENNTLIQKEASLDETIKKLQQENDTLIQKEASLDETIKKLHQENDTLVQKEASLEETIIKLHTENDMHIQKETSLEETIRRLQKENSTYAQKENSMNETIASLNSDNARLQTQVMELEESRNYLFQENQRLTESMSGLQSQIQNLEKNITSSCTLPLDAMQASGSDDMNAKMETASLLVEKLVAENEELVEEVNELCVELDLQGVTAYLSPAFGSVPTDPTPETFPVADLVSEFGERKTASSERVGSLKHVVIKAEMNGEDVATKVERENGEYIYSNSPETIDSEEIVQIPLAENEVEGGPPLQLNHDEQMTEVSLTDSPLIGAPFRFVSFVARYVSGADLVNKSSVNSGKVNSHN